MMAQVSVIKCSGYDPDRVFAAVKEAVDKLGGIEKFVKPGQSVLLKPNLLKPAAPEEAVTTHPEFVRAVIRLVRPISGKIFLGDSPGGLLRTETVYERCGMMAVARQENVELVKFDRIIKSGETPFAAIKDEVDVIISLPKFKTHNLTILTLALKNVFGLVPGLHKVHCHKQAPNFRSFARLLIEVYKKAKPHLSIVDGIIGMEGEGPSSGDPRRTGLVLAGADAVAVDAVAAKIVGLEPFRVPTIRFAQEAGVGQGDLSKIEVRGEKIDDVRVRDFKLPKIVALYKLPNALLRMIGRFLPLKMEMDPVRCNKCMICRDICPEGAIREVEGRLKVDTRRCILCLCCSEMCPRNAVAFRIFKRRNIK